MKLHEWRRNKVWRAVLEKHTYDVCPRVQRPAPFIAYSSLVTQVIKLINGVYDVTPAGADLEPECRGTTLHENRKREKITIRDSFMNSSPRLALVYLRALWRHLPPISSLTAMFVAEKRQNKTKESEFSHGVRGRRTRLNHRARDFQIFSESKVRFFGNSVFRRFLVLLDSKAVVRGQAMRDLSANILSCNVRSCGAMWVEAAWRSMRSIEIATPQQPLLYRSVNFEEKKKRYKYLSRHSLPGAFSGLGETN